MKEEVGAAPCVVRGAVDLPVSSTIWMSLFFFFQAEDGIRDDLVTGVQTCALPISERRGKKLRNLLLEHAARRDVFALLDLRRRQRQPIDLTIRGQRQLLQPHDEGDRKSVV